KGEHRSHWRKLMEHGSFCGACFAPRAGNFALQHKTPVQMRQPEDIPNAVFAAAGVHRDLTRTATSSQGPVEWNTAHYKDGTVQKPAVCAFNFGLPWLFRDGTVREGGLSGNSFAGPMFCGSIALMLSADPDLLPWDLREIITSTAMDIAAEGVDYQTGHGLINCYRAVKEVLRRKAAREGKPTKRFEGRERDDELDVASLAERVKVVAVVVGMVAPKGQAKSLGVEVGDVIVEYNGEKILTRAGLREQIKAARAAKAEEVPMVLRRGKKKITIKLKPGRIGIGGAEQYSEPVFQKG
ncbi:MAG: S8 family serine peptidase, partial [bacterium]|nr:S8 family serine peptidase [bacterium]